MSCAAVVSAADSRLKSIPGGWVSGALREDAIVEENHPLVDGAVAGDDRAGPSIAYIRTPITK
jgi:hypothetical protein